MIVDGDDEEYFASLSKHQVINIWEKAEHIYQILFFYIEKLKS